MLLGWLFALAASWANACVPQPERSGHHPQRSGFVAPQGAGHEAAAGAGGVLQLDPAQLACASFCDTDLTIATKGQTAKGDGASQPMQWVASVNASWLVFMPARAEVRWRPRAASLPPGPPVAIAFLRLTL
jgi:hypothetical protein